MLKEQITKPDLQSATASLKRVLGFFAGKALSS
jgi:hypothetical protein